MPFSTTGFNFSIALRVSLKSSAIPSKVVLQPSVYTLSTKTSYVSSILGKRSHYIHFMHNDPDNHCSSIAEIHISLDFHLFRVIEADGTQIQPVIVKEITIAPGQRYALEVIRADEGKYDGFWLRQRVNYEDFKYPYVFRMYLIFDQTHYSSQECCFGPRVEVHRDVRPSLGLELT